MNVEEARVLVTERLGPSWLLGAVKVALVPGHAVGEPTRQHVEVTLDYHPGFRSSEDGLGAMIGPHLTFEGVGATIEDALSVATGVGLAHDSVSRNGSSVPHADTEKVPA